MSGTHEFPLVALSILIAICASYTALTLAGRVSIARGRGRLAWLLCGSIAMGSGIWSMHFVAMLAFHLPIDIAYDVPLVALSWLAAVGASAFALFVASRSTVGRTRLVAAGIALGLAVVTMHYTGMAAVRVQAHLSYKPALVAASVMIAILASTVALLLFVWLRNDNTRRGRSLRAAAAVVMGLAIAGMHYTAMAAAHFTDVGMVPHAPSDMLLGSNGLAVPVILGAFVILTLTIAGTLTDHWVRMRLASSEALRESEERYRSVVSEIDEVIFRTDAAGRWTFLNAAWTTITEFDPAESLGQNCLERVHAGDRDACNAQNVALIDRAAEYVRHEARYVTKTGGERWVEIHARATRTPKGEFAGTAGVIRDVTERRQVEEALRTAREAAEAASRAKSEFLSRMSHELRTPLNAILGFGQLAELEAASPTQQENADHILKAGRHLLTLINEVLDITSIEAGRLHLSVEPVRVSEAVQEVLDLMEPLAAVRDIHLTLDAASVADRHVLADRQRLKQVLLNLVANAVKYNREGGSARISCEHQDGRSRIVVQDSGPGIPVNRRHRLFTAFDRLGAEQTGVEGTGLGLALSKRLVEAMSGSMGVESVVGEGSTFYVDLPAAKDPVARLGIMASDERDEPTGASPRARRFTILYVEDNLSNLTLVQRILARRSDVDLIPAMQGGLALELARSKRPDLVLLDLHLPDIQGEEVLRHLRASPDLRATPVVILSADATPGQVDRLIALGANAYVTKPLEVRAFIDILDGVLDARAAA